MTALPSGLSPDLESTEEITFRLEDGILRATLTRPEAGNAMTHDQRRRLLAWLERANEDPGVRCVVLGATGRFFCTGADLRNGTPPPPRDEKFPEKLVGDARRVMVRGAIKLVAAIMDCEKPVIASVQGTAAGIGSHVALACDLVYASNDAKFIEIFARRGLVADGLGTYLLPRLIGLQRAKELIFFADDIPAQRAYELGMITRAVPADELETVVDEAATRLATGPTAAHRANKWLLNRSFDVDRATLAAEEAWLVDIMTTTEDSQEGVASFLERRPPVWRGY
jgi:2-(1,2-epoxy-1,2-dihydrophenyl)acetyl-CoA isomerase